MGFRIDHFTNYSDVGRVFEEISIGGFFGRGGCSRGYSLCCFLTSVYCLPYGYQKLAFVLGYDLLLSC